MSKAKFRELSFKKRSEMTDDDFVSKSEILSAHLFQYVSKLNVSNLFIYSSFHKEPELNTFIDLCESKYTFSLPVISEEGSDMDFFHWSKGDELVQNRYGILEPAVKGEDVANLPDESSLIIVPCLAADQFCYRLGYGGGYYDRYLNAYPNTKTVGVVFSYNLYEEVPSDSWDVPLGAICTEKKY